MKNHPFLIKLGICLMVFLAVASLRGLFTAQEPAEVYRALCDGFFVAGALLTCYSVIRYCARDGAYDIFGYGMKNLKAMFIPTREVNKRYYDFKQEKAAKRQPFSVNTLILGLCFLAASGVCLLLYNSVA